MSRKIGICVFIKYDGFVKSMFSRKAAKKIPFNINSIEDFLIKTELISWEKNIGPILLDNNLKKYCDLFEE